MSNPTFLKQLAQQIILNYADSLSDCVIILPNKRAKVFLINELQLATSKTIFSPEIISIEEFVQNIAGIRAIDSVELLFEFYEVYCSIEKHNKLDEFENFANWAKTLLQDFNEIDRYLIDPDKILNYLENIKEIEHWSVDVTKRTDLIAKHLLFWKKLPHYYHSLYRHLLNKGIGYQGLIYREAKENLNHFTEQLQNERFIFAGFNALNHAEELIVQHLLAIDKAVLFWDIDEVFLKDELHDAGLFQRKFKKEWNYYKTNPYQWITANFATEKNIEIISTPKAIGQAKIVGHLIEEKAKEGNLQNVAIVLGEENLLLPILYSLPKNVDALNITMGFSSKNNPAQLLISKLFKLHVNTTNRNSASYTMYFKDVLDVLTNPLVEPYVDAFDLVNKINRNNFSFISWNKLHELYGKENELFKFLFKKWDANPTDFLENSAQVLLYIKSKLSRDNEEEKITNAFVYSIYKVINKLISYFANQNSVTDLKTLVAIYKQVIDVAEVSFEGEPLEGLQIMGVLESRVLDFETVIITSVNEGKFPAGKSTNSFIPYDVKREYGLPTFKEKDAIYTYHFYHLLQRAKTIYLLYNSDSEGFDAGEKSRFITQLEIEKQANHTLTHSFYNPIVPAISHELMVIEKSEMVQNRLKVIAETGFSPSSLTSYIRNPIQFYFQRILRIKETDEVEENIAVNTLGTIIHGALEELYKPFIGQILTVAELKIAYSKIANEVTTQFKEVYKEGEIKTGRNLLAFEVAKRNVENFIKAEIIEIEQGAEIQILALEATYERTIADKRLPYPVLIKGNVDRIELRNNKIRIIDYKTGKVEARNITISTWDNLTTDIKNDKIIQVLAYAFMYEPHAKGRQMEAGIISFKNMKAGFLPFKFKVDKELSESITPELIEDYLDEIVTLLLEIFDKEKPFEEKV
ncbi:PD-(D/E)XK nuclease family protein [Flavobacterium sp.]